MKDMVVRTTAKSFNAIEVAGMAGTGRVSALLVCILSLCLYAAPKFPFPIKATCKYGIQVASFDPGKIQTAYALFNKNYYEESGTMARIKWDDPAFTVSEGIGYGMLIMVYMDNATNNTQPKFDKLWNYYKQWRNGNGVMHWKIRGFSNVQGENGATDAELDVALALLMAHKQWDNNQYLNDAKELIGRIWSSEVNQGDYLLKPGDAWDDKKNPSYISPAAFEMFKKVDTQHDWGKVTTNNYAMLKKCRNSQTGLVPDWCSSNGDPQGDYKYDAARTPWRMGWAYAWFGHAEAKDIAGKMAAWIKTETGGDPFEVSDGYKLDGTVLSPYCNPAFLGPFTTAGMVDAAHQAWVNAGYNELVVSFSGNDGYYNECLQVLTMLLLTGNMPNLWEQIVSIPDKDDVVFSRVSGLVLTVSFVPSNAVAVVHYVLDKHADVTIELYDMTGKVLKKIACGRKPAGVYAEKIDLSEKSTGNGMYMLRMKAGRESVSRRLVIAK